jgi:ABC-2 type transport system ATP-binding protein
MPVTGIEPQEAGVSMGDAAVELDHLSKVYPGRGKVAALDGVTFHVRPGEVYGLLGPNGAGKTTAVRVLLGALRPSSGTARVLGHDVVRAAAQVRRLVGYAAQESGMDSYSSPRRTLMLFAGFYRLPAARRRQRVRALLEQFGLLDYADRPVLALSGGLKKRLELAAALVHEPRVLLLDEPTLGLDPASRVQLWGEVERIRALGVTILLTSHYLEEVDHLAHRVGILDRGRLVVEGSPAELKDQIRGDRVSLRLATDQTAARARAVLTDAGEITTEGPVLHVRVPHGPEAVASLVSALDRRGVIVDAVEIHRPSLDDVFLAHTGRSFDRPAVSAGAEGKIDWVALKTGRRR